MAEPPDNLRAYIALRRSSYKRFPPPHTVAAFETLLKGWHDHRSFVPPGDQDDEATFFFKHFTDYVQMKTSVYASRYWGFIIDENAGSAPSPGDAHSTPGHDPDTLEAAHALFFALYDAFWSDRAAGRALRGTPPPDDRYARL